MGLMGWSGSLAFTLISAHRLKLEKPKAAILQSAFFIIDYSDGSWFSWAFFIARKTLSLRLCCIELVLSYWCCCFSVDQAEVLQRSQLAIETNKVSLL